MGMLGLILPTMTARVFASLFVAMVASAGLSLTLSTAQKNAEIRSLANAQHTDLVVNFLSYYRASSPAMRAEIDITGVPQIRPLQKPIARLWPDNDLEQTMRARLGDRLVSLAATELDVCQFTPGRTRRKPIGCWVITVRLFDGSAVTRALSARSDETSPLEVANSYYWMGMIGGSLIFAFLIAQMLTAPLKILSRAAESVEPTQDVPPLPSGGPKEVRTAAAAFATMREKIRLHVQERTQMLAAIAHDLQTPLTRMRLRAESVADLQTKRGLMTDISSMEALVREGLDLARSAETNEPFTVLNLDSMLQSLSQDALDAGQPVQFVEGCGAEVRVRPQTLQRCISNLVDNALKFAGTAEISARLDGNGVAVVVRDYGEGVAPETLHSVTRPFVRGETSRSRRTGGVGLGLTIAQILAEKNHSTINLRNHPQGGLEATISYLPVVRQRQSSKAA